MSASFMAHDVCKIEAKITRFGDAGSTASFYTLRLSLCGSDGMEENSVTLFAKSAEVLRIRIPVEVDTEFEEAANRA